MNNKLRTVLVAGFTAGLLDITAAIIVYCYILDVVTPQRLLQSIAGGVHGVATYEGGWHTAVAGLIGHFLIALIFATFFVLLYPSLRKMISNKFLLGIIYGCFVWAVMNCIVVPHSALRRWPKWNWKFINIPLSVLILIVCIGIPISLITAKMYRGFATNNTNRHE